jgi:hypothetical protein
MLLEAHVGAGSTYTFVMSPRLIALQEVLTSFEPPSGDHIGDKTA